MSDQQTTEESTQVDELRTELSKRGRDVWLAGLGALATVEEEGSKLFNTLVERGKSFEGKRQKQLEEAKKTAEEQSGEALGQVEELSDSARTYFTDAVSKSLERIGVPTKTEVEGLSEKVDTLTQQVDALTKELAKENESA